MSFSKISRTADLGAELFQSFAVQKQAPQQTQAQIGFTRPGTSFARMDVINTDAVRLNNNVKAFVVDPVFRSSWNAWFSEWSRFYDKYAGPNASSFDQASVLTWSDDFAARVTQEEGQFNSFVAEYNTKKGSNGAPLPKVDRLPNPPKVFGWSPPWWAWMGLGIGVVGIGYLVYKKYYLPVRNTRRTIDESLPDVLDGLIPGGIGRSLGKAAKENSPARDPASARKRLGFSPLSMDDYDEEPPAYLLEPEPPEERVHIPRVRRDFEPAPQRWSESRFGGFDDFDDEDY